VEGPPPPGILYGNPKDPKKWTGPWTVLYEPEKIARAITKAIIRQYNQAEHTPFCSGKLAEAIGPWATTPTADNILAGEQLPEELTQGHLPETLQIIQQIGIKPDLQRSKDSKVRITPEMFRGVYKKLDEKTRSSPSNQDISHYKAAVTSLPLTDMHAKMMEIPIRAVFAPERWCTVIDVMLPKEESVWKIHRLRIIQLYESDFNQALRLIFA
jgi:hypothetical protein